jgi:nitrogen-specific signal transduction histidine kinase
MNAQKTLAKKVYQENLELQEEFSTNLNEISQKKNQTSQVLLSIYKQTDVYISTKKEIETVNILTF